MKKTLCCFISALFLLGNLSVFAADTIVKDAVKNEVEPPVWSDYVPKKYENPRDFTRGKSIAELSVGILLTDLLLTAPIGIPMIVHSTTKLKNKGYYDKKIKFEEGLAEAEKITDPVEKRKYYEKLIKDCKLDTNRKYKKDKKAAKKAEKLAEKAKKEEEKAQKTSDKIEEDNVDKAPPQETVSK